MTRSCIIFALLLFIYTGCRSNKSCPATPQNLTEKQIKKNTKKAGKSYGLFSNKVNKSSGYKNKKATKKQKDTTRAKKE
jgi:hypothetical protein